MTAKKADTTTIELEGTLVPLDVQINGRARNISLRVDERTGGIELVLPRFVAKAEGLAFVHEKSRWIMHQVRDRPPNVPFAHGAVIPLLGIDHEIVHQEGARGTVWVDRAGATLNVAGQAPHVSRRVADWLKGQARQEISARAQTYAAAVERRIRKIQIRDTRSRWGSCSEDARLSFSWRLMLAPENVMTYVVAHEVAHLVELNHSKRFWQVVDGLCPGCEPAKYWLKRHGASLHRFG
ncbi:MAG: SprT family zinc-dependent metalloprotease [Proteobacteria bacterium]|nr:SprT family zinc-dependent metalloprotease [Pseudomonadota bacterium]MDA1058105.1 SprT family zinc-dependent metalloprotease [Pseudomonadota bacterium]